MPYDPAPFAAAGFTMICLRCGNGITECQQKYGVYHDACIACPACGEDLRVDTTTGSAFPRSVTCPTCEYRAAEAARRTEAEARDRKYETARELLIDGAGTREEREAAVEIVGDFFFGLAS